jgi:ribosome-associated protein
VKKLFELIDKALKPKKKRIPTKASKASKLRKLEEKKRRGEIKKNRRDIF